MTLRTRLLLALVALTAIGLSVAGIVTYSQQRTFLLNRVDEQISDATGPMLNALVGGFGDGFGRGMRGLPYGTYGQLRDSTGTVVRSGVLTEPYLPYQRLGIVHLTLWMKDRRDLAYDGGAHSAEAPIIAP